MDQQLIRCRRGWGSPFNFGAVVLAFGAALLSPCAVVANQSLTTPQDPLGLGQLRYIDQNGQAQRSLPLHSDVSMTVSGLTNRVTLTQTFINESEQWINGQYLFPLPNEAAVDQLQLVVGDRVIEGQVQAKQQALRTFEVAKRQGKRASLLSQLRPNVFNTAIANLGPHQRLQVRITYQQRLDYLNGEFSLRFPMLVNPRYTPLIFRKSMAIIQPPDVEPRAEHSGAWSAEHFSGLNAINSYHNSAYRLVEHSIAQYTSIGAKPLPVKLKIHLDSGFDLAQLTSLYHPIASHPRKDGSVDIDLLSSDANQDFVLKFRPQVGLRPEAAIYVQQGQSYQKAQTSNRDDYVLLMLMPPQGAKVDQLDLPRELILVIDTSGSMSGQSMTQARQALQYALDGLEPDDSFNIIEFNSDYRQFSAHSLVANKGNLQAAKGFIASLSADGGTEMFSALKAALSHNEGQKNGSLRQVIFITDGAVSNEVQLFELIRLQLGANRLFTIGIGSAPNSHFMQRAAELGKGTFTYIGKQSEVEQKVTALFEQIAHPVLSDIQLRYDDGTVPDYWPTNIPDLYSGQPLMLSIKQAHGRHSQVWVSGKFGTQQWQQNVNLKSNKQVAGLDLLWARQQISALELSKNGANEQRVDQQVLALAMKYHLVSSQTSLVAVDISPVKPATLRAVDKSIDGGMPKGWQSNGVLPQTATGSRLDILFGLSLLLGAWGWGYFNHRRAAAVRTSALI
ncbi:marine proteobacterial sortase target protein [Agarivorans sp. QJM3NY_33]|uniref:marine proteobacterial sortase target protein n=1 Tax=Agarivorans sp. QJM3NY_33 TaxID=3421432 RepID=UPI003D7D0A49